MYKILVPATEEHLWYSELTLSILQQLHDFGSITKFKDKKESYIFIKDTFLMEELPSFDTC